MENVGSIEEGPETSRRRSAPDVNTTGANNKRSKIPGLEELKADIMVRQRRVETARNETTNLRSTIVEARKKLHVADSSITRAEESLKKEKSVCNELETDRSAVEKEKQELEMRLENGGFDEKNPEDMKLLAKLEQEEEDLNEKFSGVLSKLDEIARRE
ncbi:hypothetical protein R1sor_011323 [Riccia sorocarpa]|uniref:Tropomyosin n=1 Tax=Riccia sorocarpa TaxID=122646 RepID=A0ABD3I0J9_9MARC